MVIAFTNGTYVELRNVDRCAFEGDYLVCFDRQGREIIRYSRQTVLCYDRRLTAAMERLVDFHFGGGGSRVTARGLLSDDVR